MANERGPCQGPRSFAMEFLVFTNSGSSAQFHPDNKPQNFTVHLPRPVHLEGEWECALVQFFMEGRSEGGFFVCTDVVAESHVGDFMLPVLRRVRESRTWQFKCLLYVPVKEHDFSSIRIFLRNWHNVEPARLREQAHCTLHFRRRAA